MTRRLKIAIGIAVAFFCFAALRLLLPIAANIFAGLGVEIPMPSPTLLNHPYLLKAYLLMLLVSPIAVLGLSITLLVRFLRRKSNSGN